jgi:DNA primase
LSIINEVKQRIDIVEVISEYVPLQKAGRNFKGLCPFHSENHPSFFVFPEQQTWRCFGCGIGGDVFSFVMKKEEVDFGQALRLLAQRAGITLSSSEPSQVEDKEKQRLFQINEAAAEYYHYILLNTKAGEAARSYIAKRKLTPETIKEHRLGFSLNSWEALKQYLIPRGYEEKELTKAGLIIQREDGNSYDRFRNRLMFPTYNIQGRVIGFGARALDDSLPKYINSPQTSIFDKSSSLYGIDKAKTALRRENAAIIVEGYMDALTAHQHGWQNVVASMGTSLTEKQVDILKRLTKNITLALDADVAGEEATLRGAEILAHSLDKVEVKAVLMPQGKDPDELISEDPALWQNLVEQAEPIIDFSLQVVLSRVDINKIKDKSLAVQKLLPIIYGIKDPVQQAHYVQKLALILKVSESNLTNTFLSKPALTVPLGKSGINQRGQKLTAIDHPRFAHQLISSPIEEYCLALLLQYPELRPLAQELSAEHFECTENRELFLKWQYSPDISTLKSKLDSNLLEHLDYLLSKSIIEGNDRERRLTLSDCILRLRERLSKESEGEKEIMLNLIREEGGADAELAKLEEQGIKSSQQLREIFIKKGRANNGLS